MISGLPELGSEIRVGLTMDENFILTTTDFLESYWARKFPLRVQRNWDGNDYNIIIEILCCRWDSAENIYTNVS